MSFDNCKSMCLIIVLEFATMILTTFNDLSLIFHKNVMQYTPHKLQKT